MADCTVCGTTLTAQRGPRARTYCSRACQQQAYRRRQAQRGTHVPPVVDEQLIAEHADLSSLQLAEQLAHAARRIAQTLTAGQAPAQADLDTLVRLPVVLTARARGVDSLPPRADAPPVPDAVAEIPPTGEEPPPATRAVVPPAPARRPPRTQASRDDKPADAPPAGPTAGIAPRAQRLPKRVAQAMADATELVRADDYRDTHRWVLRSGDTVLGYVEPSYGGVSRSGRNGWIGRLAGMPGPRGATRDAVAADLAHRWVQLVTAAPKRFITGSR